MIGLKRGTVALVPHQDSWHENAMNTIQKISLFLGKVAIDIQHVGSTSIYGISSKPIIDIAVCVRDLEDVMPHVSLLAKHGFIFRGEDQPGQLLFVMGDFQQDTRTHHIHVVKADSMAWKNYINFRDYLNTFPKRANEYDKLKKSLANEFKNDRNAYTSGKQLLIDKLLQEAAEWRQK